MRRLPLGVAAAVILLVLSFTGCGNAEQATDKSEGIDVVTAITAQYRKVSPQLAKEMMEEGVVVVDVRTAAEYEAGHIRNAVLIPNETITTDENPSQLPDKQQRILVYCRSGNRSAQAARKLVSLGYTEVYDFGGINTWPYELVQ